MDATQQFRELPTGKRIAVAWSFFWRAIVVTIGSAICGAIAGGILGFIIGVANAILKLVSDQQIVQIAQIVGGCAGLTVAAFAWFLYVAWLFRGTLAGFRLRLVTEAGS